MALRLAGEPCLTVQGADNQGWVREITAQDALPGLKIDQQGTGRVFDFQDGGVSKMYLPDGGNVTVVGSLVFDLANDVTITPASPAAPRTLTIPDPGADDTLAFLAATQTLTNKTLTGPTVQGTVGAGTGLTMPAFTAGGDITGGSGFALGTSAGYVVLNPAGDEIRFGNTANKRSRWITTHTASVGTSPTTIRDDGGNNGALNYVYGERTGGGGDFLDVVFSSRSVSPTAIHSLTVGGSPDTRTYSRSADALQLAMGANTYKVTVLQLMAPSPQS